MDDDYERIHLVKNEVFIYRIPPRPSNRGYRASDWKLDAPDFSGRLRLVSKSDKLFMKIEDKQSGELFAQCPVEEYPGVAIEAVLDSSRYFVVRVKDDSGKSAYVGLGFADRGDSFDLNVALQDYFKSLKKEETSSQDSGPKLDLAFKEGQTIKINMNIRRKDDDDDSNPTQAAPSKVRPARGGGPGFVPHPPSGSAGGGGGIPTLVPPPAASNQVQRGGPSPLTSPSVPLAPTEAASAPAPAAQTSSWVTF